MVPHSKSALEAAREAFQPQVPELLLGRVTAVKGPPTTCVANQDLIQARFKGLYGSPIIDLKPAAAQGIPSKRPALKVGCVLSGGQASGGHNCIVGLYDYVTKHFPGSQVYGFLGGPKGVMTNSYKLLDDATIDAHRNSGGFTMLASGRDKIETPEQFDKATHTAKANELDGLVVAQLVEHREAVRHDRDGPPTQRAGQQRGRRADVEGHDLAVLHARRGSHGHRGLLRGVRPGDGGERAPRVGVVEQP